MYKRQGVARAWLADKVHDGRGNAMTFDYCFAEDPVDGYSCLLYTSDAADERSRVDLGGRRIIKKKKLELLRTSPR